MEILPGLSDLRLILIQTDEVVVHVDRFAAYRTGLQFSVGLRFRESRTQPDGHELHPASPMELKQLRRTPSRQDGPPEIVLEGGFAFHGPLGWEAHMWLWPLPPPGPLTFVVAWPAGNIPETAQSIEAEQLLQVAARSVVLWPHR